MKNRTHPAWEWGNLREDNMSSNIVQTQVQLDGEAQTSPAPVVSDGCIEQMTDETRIRSWLDFQGAAFQGKR